MTQMVNEILQEILTSIRNPTATRTAHDTEGIQWIRMEELGKTLTNRCRTVRELSNKKQENQEGTKDRNTNSEQFKFECQLKTPTRVRIHELLHGHDQLQRMFHGHLYMPALGSPHQAEPLSVWHDFVRGSLQPQASCLHAIHCMFEVDITVV